MSNFKDMHEELFEGIPMVIGRIHKYFVTAENNEEPHWKINN